METKSGIMPAEPDDRVGPDLYWVRTGGVPRQSASAAADLLDPGQSALKAGHERRHRAQQSLDELKPVPTIKIGRARTLHRVRIRIDDNEVVFTTACGIDPITRGFTETFASPTCTDCEVAA